MEQGDDCVRNSSAGHLWQACRGAGPPHPARGAAGAGEHLQGILHAMLPLRPCILCNARHVGATQQDPRCAWSQALCNSAQRERCRGCCAGPDGGVGEDQGSQVLGGLHAPVPGHHPAGEISLPLQIDNALQSGFTKCMQHMLAAARQH